MSKGKHPVSNKSLANLNPITSPEMAEEYRRKGYETRMRNKAIRDEIKDKMEQLAKVMKEDEDAFSALDVLRYNMYEALEDGDKSEATRIAAIIAEYESPKLQRQEVNQTISTTDMSDEELEAEIAKLTVVK
jgi:predicted  nucleic acid-binding Zn-ribbon protein